jgi:hypothetical protein
MPPIWVGTGTDKAHHVRYYADIVSMAMRTAYPGPLAWVELFAGRGRLRVKDLEQYHPGSPVEAVTGVRQRYDHYVFADLDPLCVEALHYRVGNEAGVHVLQGDANAASLHDQIVALVPAERAGSAPRTPPTSPCTSRR